MKIQILDKTKKKKFVEGVGFGLEKIPYLLIHTGKETIRGFSGSLSNEEIMSFWREFPIEGIGLYFGKEIIDKKTGRKEARLSLDALHFLKDKIKEKVIVLDENQEKLWWKGKDIDLDVDEKGFVALKNKQGDFIGVGKISGGGLLLSYLPKERRVREN